MNQLSFSSFMDVYLYEMTMVYIVGFVFFVLLVSYVVVMGNYFCIFFLHGSLMEFFWTSLPIVVLTSVFLPSMWCLFLSESFKSVDMSIKVIGHQWYWSYYFVDFDFQLDSYMSSGEDLSLGGVNLLSSSSSCVLPLNTGLQFYISSSDVLHSWAIPSLCLKMDAIPGVSSVLDCFINFPGLFYGMCSELCGSYHAFMPISVEVSSFESFSVWLGLMVD